MLQETTEDDDSSEDSDDSNNTDKKKKKNKKAVPKRVTRATVVDGNFKNLNCRMKVSELTMIIQKFLQMMMMMQW